MCTAPVWLAPEVIMGKKYLEKANVYSAGVIMWEIAS
jgi:serine/threonine protein kinase